MGMHEGRPRAGTATGMGGGTVPSVLQFGDVRVDVAAHRLLRSGKERLIEPKAYAVLVHLLSRPGQLVVKDELLDLVWGHRQITPGVLTRLIGQIRHAIGDDAESPRYIQTVHKLGYCFIGHLRADGETATTPRQAPAASTGIGAHSAESKDHYTLGRRYWYERSPDALVTGLAHFREALRADPQNGQAWCGIADSYLLLNEYADVPFEEAVREARGAIGVALGIDPDLAQAYASQGLLELELRHFPLAISLLEQAAGMDPTLGYARGWHAMALSLDGRLEDSEAVLHDALERDPHDVVLLSSLSLNLILRGRHRSAEQLLGGLRRDYPGFLESYWQLAWSLAQHGQLAAAYEILECADAEAGASRWTDLLRADVALMCGSHEVAERVMRSLPVESDFRLWRIYVHTLWAASRFEEAIDFLRRLVVGPLGRVHQATLLAHSLAACAREAEALALYDSVSRSSPMAREPAIRPWEMAPGLGEQANHIALLDGDHPSRGPMLHALGTQIERLRQGGVRLPVLDYQFAVLAALRGDIEHSLRSLDRALEEGFVDAMAFRRDLAWQRVDAASLAERERALQGAVAQDRLLIERPPSAPEAV